MEYVSKKKVTLKDGFVFLGEKITSVTLREERLIDNLNEAEELEDYIEKEEFEKLPEGTQNLIRNTLRIKRRLCKVGKATSSEIEESYTLKEALSKGSKGLSSLDYGLLLAALAFMDAKIQQELNDYAESEKEELNQKKN